MCEIGMELELTRVFLRCDGILKMKDVRMRGVIDHGVAFYVFNYGVYNNVLVFSRWIEHMVIVCVCVLNIIYH